MQSRLSDGAPWGKVQNLIDYMLEMICRCHRLSPLQPSGELTVFSCNRWRHV